MSKTDEVEILLVEDNAEDMELALHALRQNKMTGQILVARDGEEALEFFFCRGKYKHRSFDSPPRLVLLDVKLPKVDGLQVLLEVKSDPRTRAIPVVILTSSREEQDVACGYQRGVNSYIQKPLDFTKFRELVKQLGMYWLQINVMAPARAFEAV